VTPLTIRRIVRRAGSECISDADGAYQESHRKQNTENLSPHYILLFECFFSKYHLLKQTPFVNEFTETLLKSD
jgi:hypothetical protein